MEKKWLMIGIIALFIAVAATTYYVSSRQHSVDFLSEDDLSNPELLTGYCNHLSSISPRPQIRT